MNIRGLQATKVQNPLNVSFITRTILRWILSMNLINPIPSAFVEEGETMTREALHFLPRIASQASDMDANWRRDWVDNPLCVACNILCRDSSHFSCAIFWHILRYGQSAAVIDCHKGDRLACFSRDCLKNRALSTASTTLVNALDWSHGFKNIELDTF